jgi:hypothetical protein
LPERSRSWTRAVAVGEYLMSARHEQSG